MYDSSWDKGRYMKTFVSTVFATLYSETTLIAEIHCGFTHKSGVIKNQMLSKVKN